MTRRFEGKTAVVTGAARGIGAAAAGSLAREGAAVALLDVASPTLEQTTDAIQREGGRALAVVADVGSEPAVAAASARIEHELGPIDLLACFAGVVGYAPLVELDEREWDRIMRVNAKGPFLCAKHAIPQMRRRGGGAIVLTSSVMAFAAEPATAAYSASKGAVASLTRALAVEHAAEGIRVNCIAPGVIRTELLVEAAGDAGGEDPAALIETWGRRHPIDRLIEPSEVVEPALFLLSDRAGAITGACHRVDGGLLGKLG